MTELTPQEISSALQIVRDATAAPDLRLEEAADQRWTSHQTLDIIFAVERQFGLEFSGELMETIENFATLLKAIAAAMAH